MDYETIIYEKREKIAIVTLNRPKKKNAISSKMWHELGQVVDEIEKDVDLKVMILTGGSEAFCSGADLSEVQESKTGRPERGEASPIEKIRDMSKPTIAAISGSCVAGGIELALACDILVGSETARIGDGHIKMGLLGVGGSTTRIPRMIGRSKAMELILTGDLIDGKEALQIGILNHVYPKDKLMDETMALAKKIGTNPPTAIRLTKKAVDAACDMDEYQSYHYTKVLLSELLASAEFRERVAAFLQKGK